MTQLFGDELSALARQAHEIDLIGEIIAHLALKRRVGLEFATAIFHARKRFSARLTHIRLHLAIGKVELLFGKHVHARLEVAHMKNRMVHTQHTHSLSNAIKHGIPW